MDETYVEKNPRNIFEKEIGNSDYLELNNLDKLQNESKFVILSEKEKQK